MQKMLAGVLVVLLTVPSGAFAQSAHSRSSAGPLLAAALAEAANLGSSLGAIQVQDDTWNQLQSLPVGMKVRVTLTDGAEIEGQLVEVRTDAVVLEANKLLKGQYKTAAGTAIQDRRTFLRTELTRVQPMTPKTNSAKRPVLVGTLVGAGGGVLVGSIACRPHSNCPYQQAFGAYVGVAVGAGIGALTGWLISR